jgi:O-acetyl-ADP-ribose deacetylase (regulator of RNase III)
MLIFKSGDLFSSSATVLVNPVNCVGVMGAGLAQVFRQKYPDMVNMYQHECWFNDLCPGKLYIWDDPSGITVVNFPTKVHWKQPSEYAYIELGLFALRDYLEIKDPVSVAIPALGCGLGGLEWDRVVPMIKEYLSDLPAKIEVFCPQ